MKIFTKLFVGCLLVASQLANAQAPLLPLFENNSIKWGANSWYKSSGTGVSNNVTTKHELIGDTSIDSKKCNILLTNNRLCFPGPTSAPFCVFYTSKKFLLQESNLILEVDKNGKLVDTVLFMQSTNVNSKVRFLKEDFSITSVDSIIFENSKRRRFIFDRLAFEGGFGYIDGIGFDNNGPYAVDATGISLEGKSFLNCFEKNGFSYSMENNSQNNLISAINISTTSCENPLSFEDQNLNININSSVLINQNNQLETSQIGSSIEIFNSKGQKVLQNKDASTTDISSLSNGFYIANITFDNKQVKHKFLVNN